MLEYQGSAVLDVTGRIAMRSQGGQAYAGMFSNVCEVFTDTGWLGTEYHVDPEGSEAVTDWDDGSVLSITSNGWFQLRLRDSAVRQGDRAGLRDARLDGDGVVSLYDLRGGCGVRIEGAADHLLPGDCPDHDGWAVDPIAHTAWVAIDGVVWAVDADSATETDIHADRVTVDGRRGLIAAAWQGGRRMAWWSTAGLPLGEAELPGPVQQITAAPAQGLVVALCGDARGSAVVLVSETSDAWAWGLRTREPLLWVSVSESGAELALGRDWPAETTFFHLP